MVDFIGSFNKGLSAAQQAEKNREEIFSVLEILNAQLTEVSAGTVQIDILEKSLPFFDIMTGPKTGPRSYTILAAYNPKAADYKPVELSKWKIDPNGYPCLIITQDDEIYCEDKSGLERGLQALISSPAVGEKLYAVMKQKQKPSEQE
jgi:hypothetical protein